MTLRSLTTRAATGAGLALMALAAQAEGDRAARVPLLPLYQQECGSCHTAYAPGLLPAASWQRLMGQLPRHFGSDASLDPAALKQLSGWLAQYAANGRRAQQPPPDDRITRSEWFVREHRELPPEVWKRPSVGSASNCSACHSRTAEGRYSEHDVRIPR